MLRASCLKDVPLVSSPDGKTEHAGAEVSSYTLHRTNSSSLDVREYAPGEFEWRVDESQSACVLCGSAWVDFADGRQVFLSPGDSVFLPAGMHGRWIVQETLRTVSVTNAFRQFC